MSFVVLLFVALLFVLGFKGTTTLFSALKEVEQRRNLLYRLGGFFAMSAWLHVLPLILITIFMQEEGILATTVFSEDEPIARIATLYVLPQIVLLVLLLTIHALLGKMEGNPYYIKSWGWIAGLVVASELLFPWGEKVTDERIAQGVFLIVVSLPFAIYLWIAIRSSFERQIKLFWLPIALIVGVTILAFSFPTRVHSLVRQQLAEFGVGGNVWVVLTTRKNDRLMGSLVLLTQKSAYVKPMFRKGSRICVVRVPIEDVRVTTFAGNVLFRSIEADDNFVQERASDWARDGRLARETLINDCGPLAESRINEYLKQSRDQPK